MSGLYCKVCWQRWWWWLTAQFVYWTFIIKLPFLDAVASQALPLWQTSYLSQISQIIFVEKKLPCGEFSAFHVWRLQGNQKFLYMWRNFRCLPMTDVEKSEILHIWHVCDVENVAIYAKFMLFSWKISFVKIYALCREIRFVVIYALLCGEKFIQKFCMWRKNDKYQVCVMVLPRPMYLRTDSLHFKCLNKPFF